MLDVYAKDDPIIPPKIAPAQGAVVGSSGYSETGRDGGHVGILVSRKSAGQGHGRPVARARPNT